MLLLIMTKEEIKDLYSNSNTSHVTINLACYHPILPIERHSNTSHVTINPYNHFPLWSAPIHSNTSHVTINLKLSVDTKKNLEFKYISCYY